MLRLDCPFSLEELELIDEVRKERDKGSKKLRGGKKNPSSKTVYSPRNFNN
jgi:hypothetical protein